MKELLEMIDELQLLEGDECSAELVWIGVCALEGMHAISRKISSGRPAEGEVAGMCVQRWWFKAMADVIYDRGLDDTGRRGILVALAEAIRAKEQVR